MSICPVLNASSRTCPRTSVEDRGFPLHPRRPGEDASISIGFCCYKSGQKATASLPAPLVFFVLVLVIEHLFSLEVELISKVFVLDVQELGLVIHKHISILGEGGLFQNR